MPFITKTFKLIVLFFLILAVFTLIFGGIAFFIFMIRDLSDAKVIHTSIRVTSSAIEEFGVWLISLWCNKQSAIPLGIGMIISLTWSVFNLQYLKAKYEQFKNWLLETTESIFEE